MVIHKTVSGSAEGRLIRTRQTQKITLSTQPFVSAHFAQLKWRALLCLATTLRQALPFLLGDALQVVFYFIWLNLSLFWCGNSSGFLWLITWDSWHGAQTCAIRGKSSINTKSSLSQFSSHICVCVCVCVCLCACVLQHTEKFNIIARHLDEFRAQELFWVCNLCQWQAKKVSDEWGE